MAFHTKKIQLATQTPIELINLTPEVQSFVQSTSIQNGFCLISIQHTTAALKINEECPHLRQDFLNFFKTLVPAKASYLHNIYSTDNRPNAHSHLLSMLLESNQTLSIIEGQLVLGTWQSIFMIELDGPRPERNVLLTAWGDSI